MIDSVKIAVTMKSCGSCGEPKALSLFYRTREGYLYSECKSCTNKRANRSMVSVCRSCDQTKRVRHGGYCASCEKNNQRARKVSQCACGKELSASARFCDACWATHREARWKSKLAAFSSLKAGKLCVDCGLAFPPACLDFDHVDEKYRNLAAMKTYAAARIIAETNKTELVCAVCHAKRTSSRRGERKGRKRPLEWIVDLLKEEFSCTDCGAFHPAPCMQFDHLPGFEKKHEIADLRVGSLKQLGVLLDELDKTELVCACCHRKRTVSRLMEAA